MSDSTAVSDVGPAMPGATSSCRARRHGCRRAESDMSDVIDVGASGRPAPDTVTGRRSAVRVSTGCFSWPALSDTANALTVRPLQDGDVFGRANSLRLEGDGSPNPRGRSAFDPFGGVSTEACSGPMFGRGSGMSRPTATAIPVSGCLPLRPAHRERFPPKNQRSAPLLPTCSPPLTAPASVPVSAFPSDLTSVFNRTPGPTLACVSQRRSARRSSAYPCTPTDLACLRVSPPGVRHG